jgi:peptidylprolyl isomerase
MLKEKFFTSHLISIVLISLFSISLFSFTSMKTTVDSTNIQEYENVVYMKLKDGMVVIELFPDKAPKHVEQIKRLIRQGFYDNLAFHRVIDGFMAQGGDPRGDGTGGSGKNIPAEFSNTPHKRGILSMARAQDPNSADSQFFIVLKDSPFLDGQYTVFGRVISGMEFVDKIKKGSPMKNGSVINPDKIISMAVASDVEAIKTKAKK